MIVYIIIGTEGWVKALVTVVYSIYTVYSLLNKQAVLTSQVVIVVLWPRSIVSDIGLEPHGSPPGQV